MPRHSIRAALLFVVAVPTVMAGQQGPPPPIGVYDRSAETPSAGTAVISGTLTVSGPGGPARKATVRLVNPSMPRAVRTVTTDENGRYDFTAVAAGDYVLSASRPGYLDMVRGARVPGATSQGAILKVADGQKVENVSWSLPRAGVISGTILDELGDPAFNVPVRAFRFIYQNGRRALTSGGTSTTDDRGAYRIAGLMPGEYLVSAVPRETVAQQATQAEALRDRFGATPGNAPPSPTGYVPVHFPAATQGAMASPVRVGTSEEISNIDIRLQFVKTATVTGTITSAEALPQTRLQLLDLSTPLSLVGVWFRDMRPDGTFTFAGVVPGNYIVQGFGTPGGKPGTAGGEMWGSAEIVVSPDGPNQVALRMQRGVMVSGRIRRDTLPAGLDPARLRITLQPVPSATDWELGSVTTTLDAEGSFSIGPVVPAHYRVVLTGAPDGVVIATAMFEEKDAADLHVRVDGSRHLTGLEIALAPRLGQLSGMVTTAQGGPAPDHSILLFPTDRTFWIPQSRRVRQVQPGPDGRYLVRDLPPGEYRVVPVLDPEPGRLFDPEYLAHLYPVAAVVTIGAGPATQDFRLK